MTVKSSAGMEVGREDHAAVAVDDEWLHGSLPSPDRPSRSFAADRAGSVGAEAEVVRCGQHPAGRASARTVVPCWSRVGGAACAVRVTSWPARSKNRSGGPASWSGPRVSWLDVDRAVPGCGSAPRRTPRRWCAPCLRGRRSRPQPGLAARLPSSSRTRPRRVRSAAPRLADGLLVGGEFGVVGSMSNPAQNRFHIPRCPPRLDVPSAEWNRPYGPIETWWLPSARPTSPATVQLVTGRLHADVAASSEVRTTAPLPVRPRSTSAATTP